MGRPKANRKLQHISLGQEAYRILRQVSTETGESMGRLLDQAILEVYGTDGPISQRVTSEIATMRESLKAEIFDELQRRERQAAIEAGLDPDRASRLFPVK